MPSRSTFRPGTPCWIDLSTSDPDATRRFYGELFGWQAQEASEEFGGYFMFLKDGKPVAGCMPGMPDAPTDMWTIYLATDDLDRTLEAVSASGGQVQAPATPISDMGSMAIVADTGGAAVGLWQPETFPGVGVETEPGAPSWYELRARDYDAAVGFYREALGWETHTVMDDESMRYTVCVDGEDWRAGIEDAAQTLPEDVPPHWSVYIGTDDTDRAVARTEELGGRVLAPAADTPYGRIAEVTDATGTRLHIISANEAMPAR